MNTVAPCPEWHEQLCAFHDKQLPAEKARRVEAHLGECAACRQALEQMEADRARMVAGYADSTGGDALRDTVLAALHAEQRPVVAVNVILRRLHWAGAFAGAAMFASILLLVMLSLAPENSSHRTHVAGNSSQPLAAKIIGITGNTADSPDITLTLQIDDAAAGAQQFQSAFVARGGLNSFSDTQKIKAHTRVTLEGTLPAAAAEDLLHGIARLGRLHKLIIAGKDITAPFASEMESEEITGAFSKLQSMQNTARFSMVLTQGEAGKTVALAGDSGASPALIYTLLFVASISTLALLLVVFVAPWIVARQWQRCEEQRKV